jgi:cephalosporin-C deacetylase
VLRRTAARAFTVGTAYLAVHRGAEEAAYRTLSHLEGISFARRAQTPAHFGVGLRDTVCPPSGAYAAFNRYTERRGDGGPSCRVGPTDWRRHSGRGEPLWQQ